ncbi:MAG: sensor histidine kinase, partial [Anaerolineales bacterium]
GYTDLLRQAVVGPVNEQQLQFLNIIRSNVERMSVLVSDLSDISRIETGRLQVQIARVAVAGAVREVLESLQKQIEAKGQTLQVEIPDDLPLVRADKARLVQVLSNLLSNANKYSPPGGDIALAAEADLASEEGLQPFVRISVRDTGFGISAEDQARLFSQFFRSEDPNIREQSGWGLGLHITRRLVELLGGEMSVESELGQGSTFAFTLPTE